MAGPVYIDFRKFKQCSCGLQAPVMDCATKGCPFLVCEGCMEKHARRHAVNEDHATKALQISKEEGDAYHA